MVCPCRILKLTVEQKCDIATRELDELRDELQRKKDEEERALDNHRVRPASLHPEPSFLRAELDSQLTVLFFFCRLWWVRQT